MPSAASYKTDDAAIEARKTNATESFTLKVTDGSAATDTQPFTVNITGANDTPTLSASVSHADYTAPSLHDALPIFSGTLSIVDRDNPETVTYSISGQVAYATVIAGVS